MGGAVEDASFGFSCMASDSVYEYDDCDELPVELFCFSTGFVALVVSHCVATERVVSPDSLSVFDDSLNLPSLCVAVETICLCRPPS